MTSLDGAGGVNGFGGKLQFQTKTDNSSTSVTRMVVDSSGRVGIGTTAPGAKLEVAGQVKITGGTPGAGKVLTSDASGLATWETPAAGGVSALTGDVTASGSGSVSATIANNAVTTGKILNGTILNEDIANTTIAYGKLNLADEDIPVAKLARINCSAGEVLTSDIILGYRCVADNSTDATKVPLAGGTMTGALILSADPAIALGAATKQYVDGLLTSAASSGTNTSVQISNGSGGFASSTWFNFSSGKLGVGPGTTTPTNQLTVISNGDDVPVAKFQNGDSRGAGIEVKATNTGGADFWIQATADNADEGGGKLSFRDRKNADASRMVIDSVGKVGIGTTTPASTLHVSDEVVGASYRGIMTSNYGGTGALLTVVGARGTKAAPAAIQNTNYLGWIIGTGFDGSGIGAQALPTSMNFAASEDWSSTAHGSSINFITTPNGTTVGVNRLKIDHNGNVGIGTTTPGAKLDINGDISVNSSYESASAYVNSSTAYTVPDTQANIRRITLTANTTLTLPAFTSPSTKVYTLTIFLKQDAIGSHTVSFEGDGADTIIWDANTAPTIASTSNKITILQFTKVSDESVWYASMVWKGE